MEKLDEAMQKRGGKLERRVSWGEREELLEWERSLDVWCVLLWLLALSPTAADPCVPAQVMGSEDTLLACTRR